MVNLSLKLPHNDDHPTSVKSFTINDVHAACDRAEKISELMDPDSNANITDIEKAYEQQLDRLSSVSKYLSEKPSTDFSELNCKIKLWKILAPECIFNSLENTVDEKLLLSIMDDFISMNQEKF